MTNLHCDVRSCAYHCNGLCSRDGVKVDGQKASRPDMTCCGSFADRNRIGDWAQTAAPATAVNCSAHACTFNSDGRCDAKHISVCNCGCDSPCECEDTACATFSLED